MRRIVVGKVAEIPEGGRKIIVPFRGRAGIGIFNVKWNASMRCAISARTSAVRFAPARWQGRSTTSAPPSLTGGFVDYERDGEIIRCPWHAWQFDIATGQCLVDP